MRCDQAVCVLGFCVSEVVTEAMYPCARGVLRTIADGESELRDNSLSSPFASLIDLIMRYVKEPGPRRTNATVHYTLAQIIVVFGVTVAASAASRHPQRLKTHILARCHPYQSSHDTSSKN
jgi:hypothetical protein